ncbi:hypothetical protein OG613_47310 (plasmid) [Streptomyces sp. NBC_00015]|uniref:hypothetical protein n=1 Tax=Streptomyces sp. NBC_00015 TaxID=2903611 RepID=UPI002F91BB57
MSEFTALVVKPVIDHPVDTPDRPQHKRLILPTDPDDQADFLCDELGGITEPAIRHRSLTVHVHDNGQNFPLEPNAVLWTLASVWVGQPLDYLLYGAGVITGPERADREAYEGLPPHLAEQALKMVEAATAWWIEHDYDLSFWAHHQTRAAYREAIDHTRRAL